MNPIGLERPSAMQMARPKLFRAKPAATLSIPAAATQVFLLCSSNASKMDPLKSLLISKFCPKPKTVREALEKMFGAYLHGRGVLNASCFNYTRWKFRGPKLQVFLHAWWHFADQDLTVNADASVKGKSIKGSTARVSFVVREQFLPVSCLYGLRHMITPQTQEGEVYSIALGIDHAAVHYNASTICVLSDSLDAVRTFNDGKSYWDNKMEPDDKFSTKLKEAQRIVHLRGVKVVHVYRELNRAADFVSNVDHDHHDRAAEFFDGICLFWEQKKPIQKKLHDIFRDDIGLTVLVLKPVPGLYDEYDVVVPTLKRMLMGAVAIGDQWITALTKDICTKTISQIVLFNMGPTKNVTEEMRVIVDYYQNVELQNFARLKELLHHFVVYFKNVTLRPGYSWCVLKQFREGSKPVNFKEIAFPYHGVELPAFKVSIPEFYFGSFALTATIMTHNTNPDPEMLKILARLDCVLAKSEIVVDKKEKEDEWFQVGKVMDKERK